MAKKDLKKSIDALELSQDAQARIEEKISRLTELVERQKKIISQQTALLDTQKLKLSEIDDLPDDIIELKRIIGEQRAIIKDKDLELDQVKGSMVQAQKELQTYLLQKNPQQLKLEGAIETIGALKTELAKKDAEISGKNEILKTLENRIKEAESQADVLKQQIEDIKGGISKQEYDELKIKHSEERQKLKQDITKLESQLIDQKIGFEDKIAEAKDMAESYNELKSTLNELNEKNKEFKATIKSQETGMADLKYFKEENYSKIFYLEKLRPIMEEDPIFKSFFIIQDVGTIPIDDLRAAVGAPIVTIRKDIARLVKIGAIEMSDDGNIKKIEF